MYIPPFTISSKAIHLISEISAQLERYTIRMEKENSLLLRKINKIKTIQGSLAIEGNTLTESQITEILDGKLVVAPIKEIQEVKNAIETYDIFSKLNPFSVDDLLQSHSVMMKALIDDAGNFRKNSVGVVSGEQVIHLAPPAERVPTLIHELFQWLGSSDDHFLIKSCVFHYEFEYIHPFSDGNGRIGRLWQSLILGKWNAIFEFLPVENIVFANQQAYYNAINQSTAKIDSGIFIDFMLEKILETIKQKQIFTQENTQEITQENIIKAIRSNPKITRRELALMFNKTDDSIKYQLSKLTKKGLIKHVGSTKSGEWMIL